VHSIRRGGACIIKGSGAAASAAAIFRYFSYLHGAPTIPMWKLFFLYFSLADSWGHFVPNCRLQAIIGCSILQS
jgi:hypothetical protein